MKPSRRSFVTNLASLAALASLPSFAQDQQPAPPVKAPRSAPTSFAATFAKLPVKKTKTGFSRSIVECKSATTGYEFEAHQTTLMPGQMPHPPHRHQHDELFLVRAGTLEFTINDKSYRLEPGSVALASNNDLHGVKNVGTVPARYFVVAIGRD